jgi:integrative and conjugative element protein (TIGR02256 family)
MNATDLLLSSPDGSQCLLLTVAAVETISHCINQWHPLETGGILLGSYADNYRLVTIHLAAPPPPDSQHGLSHFERGTEGVLELLKWAKQQITPLYYVGEWHTHPLDSPKASRIDLKQMNDFAARCLYGASSPILLIVGGKPLYNLQWLATVHRKHESPSTLGII